MHKFEIVDIETGEVYETITSDDYIEGLDQANSRYSYLCETITNFSDNYLLRDLDN